MAKHLEFEKDIFSEGNKSHTKALKEAEGFVRRDNKENNARRKEIKNKEGIKWLSGRGLFLYKRGGYAFHPKARNNA